MDRAEDSNDNHEHHDDYKYHSAGFDYYYITDDEQHHVALYDSCTDDDCGSIDHYHVFTTRDLSARDAAQYDAGYERAAEHARYAAYRSPTHSAEHAANVGWPAIDAYLARNWSEYMDDDAVGERLDRIRRRRGDHSPQDYVTWADFDAWENELDPGVAISVRDGCTGGLLALSVVGISVAMWVGLIAGIASLWNWAT